MARLKIGSGIMLEAKLPDVATKESAPTITPSNILQMIQTVMDEQPKPVVQKEIQVINEKQDLSQFITQNDLVNIKEDMISLSTKSSDLENIINDLSNFVRLLPKKASNEITHITEVKNIAPEVLKKYDDRLQRLNENLLSHISILQDQNTNQKIINIVLGGIILLTSILHLF